MSIHSLSRLSISFTVIFLTRIFAWGQTAGQPVILRVEGMVTHPLELHEKDFATMPRFEVRAKDHDEKEHTFSGIILGAILQQAGAPLGGQLRGKNMTKYLLISSKDGYQSVFALAEIDSSFTDRTILLADKEDGVLLPPDKGPFRIIVPGEKKHARWNWGVTSLIVKSAGE
jgi:hypothetical protein